MKITVIGLGYIGLPTAVTFSKYGQTVVGVDIVPEVIEKLNAGEIHIEEPELQENLVEVIKTGRFKASLTIEKSDVFIIAVPTPNKKDAFRSCDLTYVEQAVKAILPHLSKGNTVIVESTVAPKTTENVIQPLIESEGFVVGENIHLVYCPERVLPGKIMQELISNNRIIGGITDACIKKGKEIYGVFVKGHLLEATASTAEMSKLMENTFRDVNIALANELVKISDTLNLDALEVIRLANQHPRVNIHQPGPGVGGHCLAVDPYFIIANAPEESPLIQKSREINNSMPEFIVRKVLQLMEDIQGKKLTIFGASYKGDVDDIRESPALEIFKLLSNHNGDFEVSLYDPHVEADFVEVDREKAIADSDLLLILTDHTEFRELKVSDFDGMAQKNVFDTRNVVQLTSDKVTYYHMGRLPK